MALAHAFGIAPSVLLAEPERMLFTMDRWARARGLI